MASTRYIYDKSRTKKNLQESTGAGRYMLNTPGQGIPQYFEDPQMRMQRWGGNLMGVTGGHPIDIDSDLIGLTRKLKKFCNKREYPNKSINNRVYPIPFSSDNKTVCEQSRVTHPAWMYKDLEQDHRSYLFLDPQENVCKHFQNNLNTRILESDNFKPVYVCPLDYVQSKN